ncbi:nuclear pore complex protein Nup50 isoform X1 [Zootermopsis nevadensis]|nr:nuclear pore complex protein Nup50 isoform X1 [Zootermopsis nevadensis]XP_021931648.1 nuclear pore complex protein Nup50 isoform X1 [Zootermopsis nevadensis]XP_021931649.1 nuclear pore complex protein Nup50 isoform X1 [Zootermopsis nevadensis]XP_021931650.1 nuclear pore complex protein Nup50 isoform X1 [Zootermopsis nevadensis]
MAKRIATSELNHENWNEEDKPEEAGTFRKATPDVIQHRVIKSAKRRSVGTPEDNGATVSPFVAFGGFKPTSTNSASATSAFNFLKNSNKPSDTSNGSASKEVKTGSTSETSDTKSPQYYSKLKSLNQCVSHWIKSHVDSNPFCILTPIFRDYERFLTEIDQKESSWHREEKEAASVQREVKSLEKSALTTATGGSVTPSNAAKPADEGAAESRKPSPFSTTGCGSNKTIFNFGSGPSSRSNLTAGFTFGSSQPFTFQFLTNPDKDVTHEENADDQPPKVEFTPVVEEGAIYSKRCKVFVKKEASFQERGVGMLHLKPVGEKTQLIVRADTSLGNLLVNTLLTAGLPIQRMGTNNVMLVCVPMPDTKPPPIPILLRLKTSDDADEVHDKLKEHIK